MTAWTGWLTIALIVAAVLLPVGQRIRVGKRAAPDSRITRTHVLFGISVVVVAFVHTLAIVPNLGSPEAVAGGMLALLPGGIAFFLLMAHAGIGFQLRNVRLRNRAQKRRTHLMTATAIGLAAAVHVVTLLQAAR